METANHKQETFLAKWTYEQLSVIRDQSLGAALRMPEHTFKVYDVLLPALTQIVSINGERAGNIIKVPSPWHAALILESLQHHFDKEGKRLIFRGQSDSTWEITSSLYRKGSNEKLNRLRGKLFGDILSGMSFNTIDHYSAHYQKVNLTIDAKCYEAAAQHYGIPTALIDFTADAAVAVFFASQAGGDRKGKYGSVFVLSIDQLLENNFEIVIPPPFIERLFVQRGFFLKMKDEKDSIDKSTFPIYEIQFSLEYDFYPFKVIRNNTGEVDILKDSAEMEHVLQEVNALPGIENISQIDYTRYVEAACYKLKNVFKEVYSRHTEMWAKYVDAFEDMLYWTVYFTTGNQLKADLQILDKITGNNEVLTRSIIQFYYYIASHPEVQDEEKKRLTSLSMLLEHSVERNIKT